MFQRGHHRFFEIRKIFVFTLSDAESDLLSKTASIAVTPPFTTPVASPVLFIVAESVSLDVQFTVEVIFDEDKSEK